MAPFFACQTDTPAPPLARPDPEIADFLLAATWPEPEPGVALNLANIHFASGRNADAWRLFSELHRDHPDNALFLALSGVFRTRMSGQQVLTSRVAWVEDSLAILDRAVQQDSALPRFFRALTWAQVPARFDRAEAAIEELEDLISNPDSFFFSDQVNTSTRQNLIRTAYQAIGQAYDTLSRPEPANQAWARAGGRPERPDDPALGTQFAINAKDGFRFIRPYIERAAENIYVARGYDFGDIVFVVTEAGVVAIDAGTTVKNAQAARAAFAAKVGDLPIHTVILTHAHWDHIGGLDALRDPGTRVIAQADFDKELAIVNGSGIDYLWFFGAEVQHDGNGPLFDVRPDTKIARTQTLTVGNIDFELIPIRGGETEDALLVHLPNRGVVFTGDAFMPYLGAPFVGEGDADELLETIAVIEALSPTELIHGHLPLTELFTAEALPPLRRALTEIRTQVLEGIQASRSVAQIVTDTPLPASLENHPYAVIPTIVMKTQFIQRLHRSRTGYWQPDLSGLEVISNDSWTEALDVLAGHDPTSWQRTLTTFTSRGDHALAWRLAEHAISAYPNDAALKALRRRALNGLRQKYQQINPFKFIVYSELAGIEHAPLP